MGEHLHDRSCESLFSANEALTAAHAVALFVLSTYSLPDGSVIHTVDRYSSDHKRQP